VVAELHLEDPPARLVNPAARAPRVDAVDLLRGIVMVLMMLDHTRDFAYAATFNGDALDLSKASPLLFFTRWITHFCAPTFVFLAGTGIMLQRLRDKPLSELSWFLFTRGLWLIFLEFTAVRTVWLWNLDYSVFLGFAQVIFAIGCSMIIMAALVRLPIAWVFGLGLAITLLHDLFDPLLTGFFPSPGDPPPTLATHLLAIFFGRGTYQFGAHGPTLFFGYAIIPWLGVMALGYAIGVVYRWTPAARQRALLWAGGLSVLAFIVIRALNGYGDPFPWEHQATPTFTLLSFLKVNKYPPSLDFLLMTLGPAMIALAVFERIPSSPLSRFFVTFGRVPMFFYLLQWVMAHGLTLVVSLIVHKPASYLTEVPFYGLHPGPNSGFTLGQTYLLWITGVLLLYPLCRWYAQVKRTHSWWWLSYI
jgi:uncharacterized membrane protein